MRNRERSVFSILEKQMWPLSQYTVRNNVYDSLLRDENCDNGCLDAQAIRVEYNVQNAVHRIRVRVDILKVVRHGCLCTIREITAGAPREGRRPAISAKVTAEAPREGRHPTVRAVV